MAPSRRVDERSSAAEDSMKETTMELTSRGYELTFTIRRRRQKSKQEKVLPVTQRTVAGPATEHRHPLTTGFSHIVPPR
jgi:hypothetical protein